MRGFNNIYERLTGRIIIAGVVALVASLSLSSCHKHHSPEQVPSLQISIYIPQPVATKATIGDVLATEEEKKINELIVWLYRNDDDDDASAFYCLHLSGTELAKYNLESGQEARLSIKLSDENDPVQDQILRDLAANKPNLDLYAIANPPAELNLPTTEAGLKDLSRIDLESKSMSGATFGATFDGCPKTEVPTEGLPYSGVATDIRITGSFPVLVVSKVTLMRCVSKFRFVLCRMEVEDSEFEITGITINGAQFSQNEYIFNNTSDPYNISGGYEPDPVTVATSITASGIAINNTPGDLIFRSTNHESETANQYWSRLDVAKDAGKLTDVKTFYVRETDKQLTGTISYKTTASGQVTVKTKTFTMDAVGDFARNHIWVVYAYFVGGRLVVMPTVLPWTAGNDRYFFKTQGRTDIFVSSWLRYTPRMKDNDWTNTWIAVAYGFDESHPGYPKYSTQIDVDLVNENRLRLQLDNDNFRFVILEEGETVPIVWDRSVSGLDSDIIYEMAPGAHKFSFWIIPKDDYSYQGEESIVGLRLIAIPAAMAPYIIPISHNFPGNSAHSDIRFRRVSRQDYSDNMDNTYQGDDISAFWKEPKE